MNFTDISINLEGNRVLLVPLEKTHFDKLIALAKDKRIWEHYAIDGSDSDKLNGALTAALKERESGNQFPFVIIEKRSNSIIGSTRFLDIQPLHKKLEIGWTWLHPDHWKTNVNTECKLLLLTYCFEQLKFRRVQFKTDELNIRSRKAIEKIGAKYEGILRNDMVRENGTNRNSAYYSIIESEWNQVKEKLLNHLTNFNQ